jgi:hypothetical protein
VNEQHTMTPTTHFLSRWPSKDLLVSISALHQESGIDLSVFLAIPENERTD